MNTDPVKPQDQEHQETESGGMVMKHIMVPFPDTFVYSNVSALSLSMMDVRIGFGEAMPDGKALPRVGITMPIEHAAQLTFNLFNQLNLFEHNFGQIRNPAWQALKGNAQAEEGATAGTDTPAETK